MNKTQTQQDPAAREAALLYPQTGGSWLRDPETGALTRLPDEAATPEPEAEKE